MKVLKPFLNRGKEYRPGDTFLHELNQAEKAHYLRYGMLGEVIADEKPAGKTKAKSEIKPEETKPAQGPSETK